MPKGKRRAKKPVHRKRINAPGTGKFVSKYRAEYVERAAAMARHGYIDREIADMLGISRRSFLNWTIQYPKLKAALLIAKEEADNRVELSLYQLALGYEYMEEEAKIIDGKIVKVEVRKHQPGSVTAAFGWLNNRRRDHWQRSPEPEALPPPAPVEDGPKELGRNDFRRIALMLYQADKGKMN